MDFHDLNGILMQILIRIIWPLKNFYGIANLTEICKFVLIYGNPPKYRFHKQRGWQIIFQSISKRHWIGNFEWKIIVTYDIQPFSTKKGLIVWEKKKKFSIFGRQRFTFSPAKLSNSFVILIWLVKNHELLIFEYWFAPSGGFFGLKMENVIFCFSTKTAIFGR